jgi:outer membrane protein TolC
LPAAISSENLPNAPALDEDIYPIDLPSVLALAGASNLQIALASERVNAAAAREELASAMWIPSLNGGVIYNNHSGQIQGTEGEVINVNRSSLFVGGAAVTAFSPTNGGSGGPARMFVDLPLVDAIFEPLAARQFVRAARAGRTATFNDVLLQASATYYNLVRAEGRIAIAEEAVRNAEELARITTDFAESGQGLQADADRAQVEAASRRRDVLRFREERAIVSAELSRILRLDAAMRLAPAEVTPVEVEFIPPAASLRPLISQAVGTRPEVRRADAERDAACYRVRQEKFRPWLPHLYVGASGGGFGGGVGSDIDNFDDRADVDAAAVWEVQNLGFGNAALRRETRSLYRQADLAVQQVRDVIATEVAQAYQSLQLRLQQIEVTRPQVETAQQSWQLNLEGILGGELRPIEIQQAIGALSSAQSQYLDAIIDYNISQVQLLRAVGRPPGVNESIQGL